MKKQKEANRRTVLKALGAGTVGGIVIGTGTVAGREHGGDPKPPNHTVHPGDSEPVEVDGSEVGEVKAYATTNPAGKLSSLGVHLDGGAFGAFDEGGGHHDEEFAAHLHFPDVDTHQFTFNGFHYNPLGHPPEDVYDVPHFDFHFYMIEEIIVNDIPFGVAGYDIPDEQFPEGYFREGILVPEMGEHLLNANAPEWEEPHEPSGEDFTHTNVYGAYDTGIDPEEPDGWTGGEVGEGLPIFVGDNEGQLHFVEPMITTDFISGGLDEEMAVEITTPERFFEADDYPTEYVMKPDGDGGVYVSIDDFETFPGSGE